jgi:hypothetical protein
VITVTSQLVHMNVPLTPLTSLKLTPVNLSVNGPDHPIVWIQPGDTVEWRAEVEPNLSTAARQEYTQNPVLHVLSLNDPLTNLLGWDSGMLAPGLVYRRIFPQAGKFSYQDGLGHSADVYVGGLRTYLPLLRK